MKQTILQSWQTESWPTAKAVSLAPVKEGVIDDTAFAVLEIDRLFDAVNHAGTLAGQTVLYRSLTCPLDQADAIRRKQEALRELNENNELRQKLEAVLETAANREPDLYLLLFGEFLGTYGKARDPREIEGYGYLQYKRGIRFMLDLVEQIRAIEMVKSDYLRSIIEKIEAFAQSRACALMQGPVYITEKGLQCRQDRRASFTPAVIFRPTLFKPVLLAVMVAVIWWASYFLSAELAIPSQAAIFLAPILLLYFPVVGGFDRDKGIIPLRNEFRVSPELGEALDGLGQLDELFAFARYAAAFGHPMTLPAVADGAHHRIALKNARNPVLAQQNPHYVGNDLELDEQKLLLLTGPNSGGKTAFCKTVTQIQLLSQIGCYVPAESAALTPADKIFYQVPEISHLNDGEGRFGTELKRTKDIFLATTAKSLVVLDELSEGTTFEEKMEASANVLNGFYRKGNTTILITHNHQLVDEFVRQGIGMARQAEFAQDEPTYKIIDGISRVSHADRVAKKIGFSKEDIDNYLADSL